MNKHFHQRKMLGMDGLQGSPRELSQFKDGSKRRLICACTFLPDGRAAFLDRKNSELLLGDVDSDAYETFDMKKLIPGEYFSDTTGKVSTDKSMKASGTSGAYKDQRSATAGRNETKLLPTPSDINTGPGDHQLIVTFTHTDHSFAIICNIATNRRNGFSLAPNLVVTVKDRTRSVVALDENSFAATTPENVVVLNSTGDCLAVHRRWKRDRGGLMLRDGSRMVYFGDGDAFVGCRWSDSGLKEVFRYTDQRMKFPRGSAILPSGDILVCCDSSHNIHRIKPSGESGSVIHQDRNRSFGDVSVHPQGEKFVTTFWQEGTWPLLFKVDI